MAEDLALLSATRLIDLGRRQGEDPAGRGSAGSASSAAARSLSARRNNLKLI